eukprot:TRINITY_DN594_c0_g1_i4.p2 TRINITY_DN594_c0_g1~~TRINITY_DN594_c0_g1_i4.p2  ORF type:complete len:146 (+),score=56.13 TRINITY_DN594_c0_g1_i4:401-838(+)
MEGLYKRVIIVKREAPMDEPPSKKEEEEVLQSITFFTKDEGGLHTFGSEGLFHHSLMNEKAKRIDFVFFTEELDKDETQWLNRLMKREAYRAFGEDQFVLWKSPVPHKEKLSVIPFPLSKSSIEDGDLHSFEGRFGRNLQLWKKS